jgi:hypothetical protein
MLKKAYDLGDSYYRSWFGSTSPYAADYYTKIVNEQGFTRIVNVSQLAPGDLLARNESSAHVGHVLTLEPYDAANGVFLSPVAGTTNEWLVGAVDSSSSYHGTRDTRYVDSSNHYPGAGRGVIRIQGNPDGTIASFAWSPNNSTRYTDIAVGRVYDLPNH